jgi:GNAT superfamily N-acetyltransferase
MPDRTAPDWAVRDAVAGDVEAVREVAASAWRDTYTGLLATTTIERWIEHAYSVERVARRISGHTFLVVENEGRIAAFVDALDEGDRLHLAAMYARPELRGRGAGTALLDTLCGRFPDHPITADVLLGNRKGEVFYQGRGFVPREILEEDMLGEVAIERRWRRDPGAERYRRR